MDISETTPSFNLKVVVQETGIKAHTLRAWEKRYGLPQPQRTSAGHRVYSARDIELVKWLIRRQEDGLTIGRAVELWLKLQEKGEDPLSSVVTHLPEPLAAPGESQDRLSELRQAWIEACLQFNETAAEQVLTQAFAMFPLTMVCIEILQKGLAHIGELWQHNEATVQQEHFATALTIQRLDTLLSAVPPATRIGRILATCPPHEEHAVPLLLLTLLLRYRGWDVVYLRANMPLVQFEATLNSVKPNLVIMAAQRLQTAATLLEAANLAHAKGYNVAFGGMIFGMLPSLHTRIPGHYLGDTIEQAVSFVAKIMTFNPPQTQVHAPTNTYHRALDLFQSKRALIEIETGEVLDAFRIPYHYLEDTHKRLSDSIVAALRLGDLSYINPEMALERQLIANYGISLDWQIRYFEAYFLAAHKHLRNGGEPIVSWLDDVRAELSTSVS
ncbi:MAG: MerR family transcriptional regulator [Anaerolineales bacterium]|nr:MerR family transcriptional regulator [Anaerolineales bacterium]